MVKLVQQQSEFERKKCLSYEERVRAVAGVVSKLEENRRERAVPEGTMHTHILYILVLRVRAAMETAAPAIQSRIDRPKKRVKKEKIFFGTERYRGHGMERRRRRTKTKKFFSLAPSIVHGIARAI